jgi:hypothetical protein
MAGAEANRFECARCGIFVLSVPVEGTIEGLLINSNGGLTERL